MIGYSFRDRSDIEAVLDLIQDNPENGVQYGTTNQGGVQTPQALTHGFIYKTPVAGIAARSGTTVSKADCTPYWIDDGTLTELKDSDGNAKTDEVYNLMGTAITGEAYITAKRVYGVLVADAEDCT